MRVEDLIRLQLGESLGLTPWDVASETRWIRVDGELALEVSGRVWVGCESRVRELDDLLGTEYSGDPGRLCFRGYPLVLMEEPFAIVPLAEEC